MNVELCQLNMSMFFIYLCIYFYNFPLLVQNKKNQEAEVIYQVSPLKSIILFNFFLSAPQALKEMASV